jgi:polar amino acid transport system substrate-binding protein
MRPAHACIFASPALKSRSAKEKNAMRKIHWAPAAALTLLLTGCATMNTSPTPEARQALAPTGKLRVGVYQGSPFSLLRDPASGEMKGVTVDLGKELASRLGVPFEMVEYRRIAEVLDALKAGQVDVTMANATPARADDYAWTPPVLVIELGYLIGPGSKLTSIRDVDRPGMRIGVTGGGTSNGKLAAEFRNAKVVPAATLQAATDMLAQNQIDAYATNKANLYQMSDGLPGSRVLDGMWGLEHLALAIPKGREPGMAYLRIFVDEAKSSGLVARAADRAGLRGIASAGAH